MLYTRFYDKIFPTLKVTFQKVFCLSLAEAGSSTSSLLLLLLLVMWRLEVVRSCEGGGNKIVSKVEQQQQFQVLAAFQHLSAAALGKFERFHSMSSSPLLPFFFFPTLALLLKFCFFFFFFYYLREEKKSSEPHLEVLKTRQLLNLERRMPKKSEPHLEKFHG